MCLALRNLLAGKDGWGLKIRYDTSHKKSEDGKPVHVFADFDFVHDLKEFLLLEMPTITPVSEVLP